jgi:cytochrome c oxidase subunit 3
MRTKPVETGVWLGIGTIGISFVALTSAVVVRQGASEQWWHVQLPPILFANTVVLLASSATLERFRRRTGIVRVVGAAPRGVAWLQLTLALGLLFVFGQALAWRALAAQGVFLATNPSSSFFYVLTALHALHVLGGVVVLAYLLRRAMAPVGVVPRDAYAAVSRYWHFMGVLWLYLLWVLSVLL